MNIVNRYQRRWDITKYLVDVDISKKVEFTPVSYLYNVNLNHYYEVDLYFKETDKAAYIAFEKFINNIHKKRAFEIEYDKYYFKFSNCSLEYTIEHTNTKPTSTLIRLKCKDIETTYN